MPEETAAQKVQRELSACSYTNWYKDYEKVSIESTVLPIPANVLQYLLDEIIILPKECTPPAPLIGGGQQIESNAGYEDEDTEETEPPEFPEFSRQIQAGLRALGGSAYIKTNWHSPKDAFWITAGQTMRCHDITDVYQLLKASSICKDDLSSDDDADANNGKVLVLKRWKEIHPGTEFRCFIRNKHLIAISPRDWPAYHSHILTQRRDIIADIRSMFREQIQSKFPLDDYIFDVVRDQKDQVLLIDFSPFGEKWSDSLAFEWPELWDNFETDDVAIASDDPEFRYLSADCGIQPNKRNNYGIPRDVIDVYKASTDEGSHSLDDFLFNRLRNVSDQQNEID